MEKRKNEMPIRSRLPGFGIGCVLGVAVTFLLAVIGFAAVIVVVPGWLPDYAGTQTALDLTAQFNRLQARQNQQRALNLDGTQAGLNQMNALLQQTGTQSAVNLLATGTAQAFSNAQQGTRAAADYAATQAALDQQATRVRMDFMATRAALDYSATALALPGAGATPAP